MKPIGGWKIRKIRYLSTNTSWNLISKYSSETILSSGNYVSLLVLFRTSSVETVRYDKDPSYYTLMYMSWSIVIFLYFIIVTTESRSLFHCHHDGFSLNYIYLLKKKYTIILIEGNIWVILFKPVHIIWWCLTQNHSFMVTFVFWKSLLTSEILELRLRRASTSMLILKESACANGL